MLALIGTPSFEVDRRGVQQTVTYFNCIADTDDSNEEVVELNGSKSIWMRDLDGATVQGFSICLLNGYRFDLFKKTPVSFRDAINRTFDE